LNGTSVRFSNVADDVLDRMRERVGASMTLVAAGGPDWRIARRKHDPAAPTGGPERPRRNPLKAALEQLGLWGADSSAKFIPRCYLDASRAARLDLLRGL